MLETLTIKEAEKLVSQKKARFIPFERDDGRYRKILVMSGKLYVRNNSAYKEVFIQPQ